MFDIEKAKEHHATDVDASGTKLYEYAMNMHEGEKMTIAYTSIKKAASAACGCANKRRFEGTVGAFEVSRTSSSGMNFVVLTKTKNVDTVKLELLEKIAPAYEEIIGTSAWVRMIHLLRQEGKSVLEIALELELPELYVNEVLCGLEKE